MILVAGPYRSGTDGDPARIAANVAAMTEVSLELFRRGHLPGHGRVVRAAAHRGGPAARRRSRAPTRRSSTRSPSGSWPAATPACGSAARPRAPTGWSRSPGARQGRLPRHRGGPVTDARRVLQVRDDDRRGRPRARRAARLLRRASGCRTSRSTSPSGRSRPTSSSSTRPASSAPGRPGCRCRSATRPSSPARPRSSACSSCSATTSSAG